MCFVLVLWGVCLFYSCAGIPCLIHVQAPLSILLCEYHLCLYICTDIIYTFTSLYLCRSYIYIIYISISYLHLYLYHLYLYICIYIYSFYICICVDLYHIYAYIYTYLYVFISISTRYLYVYLYLHLCLYVPLYQYLYLYVYTVVPLFPQGIGSRTPMKSTGAQVPYRKWCGAAGPPYPWIQRVDCIV